MFGVRSNFKVRTPAAAPWRSQLRVRPTALILEDRTLLSFLAPINHDFNGLDIGRVATGDFTGTGIQDLAVVSPGDTDVQIFLGNGDGTFQAPRTIPFSPDPFAVAAADLTHSGHDDLVVTHANIDAPGGSVSVLLGNGDGTFQSPVTFQLGDRANTVVSADLAGRGIQDLVIVGYETVSVLMGNGDGTFQSPIVHPFHSVGRIVVGDFDGDGVLDLALTGDNSVSVLQGNGDGTFQHAMDYLAGPGAYALAAGDFNGDGALDLAAANVYSDDVSVLLNQPGASAGRRVAVKGGTDRQPRVTGLTILLGSAVTADPGSVELVGQDSGTVGVAANSSVVNSQSELMLTFTGPSVPGVALATDSYTPMVHHQGIHDDLGRSLDQAFALDFSVESMKLLPS